MPPTLPNTGPVNSADTALRARASRVIPGGLWGHMNAAQLPDGYPQYFASAEGCRLRDVDGRSFVDLMCAWGPVILGHRNATVEAAVRAQAGQGDCMNGPGPVLVDLAETLVDMVPHADWCLFGKNGTDATTSCVTIARAATGRRKVLLARGAYHGAVPWCSPSLAGVTAEDRAHRAPLRLQRHRQPRRGRGAGRRATWPPSSSPPSGTTSACRRRCRRPRFAAACAPSATRPARR